VATATVLPAMSKNSTEHPSSLTAGTTYRSTTVPMSPARTPCSGTSRVSDEVGADIVEVTPVNFQQILSRARRDLYEYLRGNCSLVTPGSACTCARKTQAFIKGGFVDPRKLTFTTGYRRRVREVADARITELSDAYMKAGADVYRGHPFYERSEQVARLREVLKSVSLESPA
jgi:hypothetical protein